MQMDSAPKKKEKGLSRSALRPFSAALLCALALTACSEDSDSMLASAKAYLEKNDVNAAGIQLRNALQKDGSLAEARFLLGKVNLQQGDVAGALKELKRAAELGYPAQQLALPLAQALFLSGEFDQVIKDYASVRLADTQEQASLYALLGDAYLAKAKTEEARQSYQQAVDANPNDPRARVGLGRSQLFGGNLDAALADAEAALALDGALAEAHALRADVLIARQRLPEAVVELEAAVDAAPRAVPYHFALISLLLRENRMEDAEKRLEAMKKVATKHPSTLYLAALMDFRKGEFTKARDGVEEVLRAVPNHLPAALLAGSVYMRLNEQGRAQQYLETVLSRVPGQPLASRLMAASLLASGEPTRARDLLQPVLETANGDNATLTLAGQTYLATGDFERASEYFAKVVAAEPENVAARTRLGVARLAEGDTQRAFEDLEAASAQDAQASEPDFALILAHLRRGEFDQALAAQQQLERKQPDNPQTYNLKGGILQAKRDAVGARAAFEKALSLRPDFLSAAVNLARLDVAEKQPEVAKQRFEKIIADNPKNVDAYLLLADLLARIGAPAADIEALLERAGQANPTAVAPKLAQANHLLRTNAPAKALTIVHALSVAHPDNPAVIGALGSAQAAAGEQQQAISTLNRLARLQPQSAAPLVALADVQRATRDSAGAEQSLRRALTLQPNALEAQQRLILLLQEGKRGDDALKVAREVQAQRPDEAIGFVFEGDILVANGRWQDAADRFAKAQARQPGGSVAVKLHAAQTRAGAAAAADKTAADWLAKDKQDLVMRGYLAEKALADKRYAAAAELYQDMLDIRPDNPMFLNNLAWVAGQLKRPDAIPMAQQALDLAPGNPAILDTLGVLQVDAGQVDTGLDNLRKAVELAPDVAPLRLNLAKSYIKVGKKDEARRELDTLLAKAQSGTPLHNELSALRQGL